MIDQNGYAARQAAWLKATGLKVSMARNRSVLRWLNDWSDPVGFDHTGVYYWPRRKVHVMLTEPYHSTEGAVRGLEQMAAARGGSFAFARGAAGAGLWLPGACFALLIARDWMGEDLEALASALPVGDDE